MQGDPRDHENAALDPWQVLARTRSAIEPSLRSAVDGMAEPIRTIAGYHLGWLDPDGRPVPAGGGKRFRPALVLLSARALGASASRAVAPAVAVELVHNASLLHDDIIDGDRTRRHRPTAWALFGAAKAILTGDALLALAYDMLGRDDPRTAPATWSLLSGAMRELIEGQRADMEFEQRTDVTSDECMAMIAGKTGSLLGAACALGGAAAGAQRDRVEHLRAFGRHLGVAYQLVDDLLGVWGAESVTGKSALSDVRRRKKSMPVVSALSSGTEAGEQLARLYLVDGSLDGAALATAASLIEVAGGRRSTEEEAERQLELALASLQAAVPDPAAQQELVALSTLVARRTH